ncbi:MAG: hypothetical protein ACHQ6U_03085, partial [Thermodesulfobacteriota bacterium]
TCLKTGIQHPPMQVSGTAIITMNLTAIPLVFRALRGYCNIYTREEDPGAGHIGEIGTLFLRDASTNGCTTREIKTDALPIEITATLPTTGEYELVVAQHGIPKDVRFKGDYFLSVKSASGDVQDIKPTDNVEN